MDHLNVVISPPARMIVKEILLEKGFTNVGWHMSDPYIRINQANFSFHSFREVKGQKFIRFNRKHLDALRLVPKEAVIAFLVSVAA